MTEEGKPTLYIRGAKAGPERSCTVKSGGYCCGGRCALHGVCACEAAMIESSDGEDDCGHSVT